MSTASCLLSQDQFRCFVCQNVFTDPVSTPCGHNFCKNCVAQNLNADVPFQCPTCQKMFYPKPELQVNTVIAELLDGFRRSAQRQNSYLSAKTRKILIGVCVIVLLFFTSKIQHNTPLTEETGGKKLERPGTNNQDMIKEIQLCLALKTEDVCLNLNLDQKRTQVEGLCAAHLEQIFSQAMEKEIPRLLIRAELMKARRYAVDVTLDPDTVHPKLALSNDRKQVRCCDPKRNLLQNPKRFLQLKYVLGKQSLSSGRFYFEVQVKGKSNWTLGVAEESVKRTGLSRLSPRSGFWSLTVRNGNQYCGLSDPPVRFSLQWRPEKVGVFVDYEGGSVFFYDVDAAALIYSFTGCVFTERLHPFFGPGHNHDGTNSAPLIITAVPLPDGWFHLPRKSEL